MTVDSMPRSIWRSIGFVVFVTCLTTLLISFEAAAAFMPPFFRQHAKPWQEIVAAKRSAVEANIPTEWRLDARTISQAKAARCIAGDFIEGLLDDDTRRITALDVPELAESIARGSLTAVKVVTAFSKRASYAHQMSGLLLEIGFDNALQRAKELDQYYATYKKTVGPLHGIPLTLKDQFHIKGLTTTMGFVSWVNTFEGKKGTGKEMVLESELVKEFHSLGAIPLGKTTLVQSLWAAETNNNFLGYTWNPWNQLLSTGGSSGGEAAMQALRGSAFGIGTDSGGSVSMPAAYQALYSIKPSVGRISYKDVAGTGAGQQVMPAVAGIMGQSVATLQLVLKSLVSTEPWLRDPYMVPLPWRSELEIAGEAGVKLTLGYMPNDGTVVPHPPISRALRMVKEALQESGHQLLDWHPPSNNESIAIHGPIARGDGCPDAYEWITSSGEPIIPQLAHLFPDGKLQPPMLLPEYEEVVLHMKQFRQDYNDYWLSTAGNTKTGRPVEAVISPVTPTAAVLPGKFFYSPYSSSLNVLDFPTVVIPVTFADKTLDKKDPQYKPLTAKDLQNMEAYNAEKYDGAPAAVQVFGPRLSEERLLSVAQIIVDALKDYEIKH